MRMQVAIRPSTKTKLIQTILIENTRYTAAIITYTHTYVHTYVDIFKRIGFCNNVDPLIFLKMANAIL